MDKAKKGVKEQASVSLSSVEIFVSVSDYHLSLTLPITICTSYNRNVTLTDQSIQDEMKQLVENLQRENKLIASAWYDVNNRLQSNTVVLQRRSDQPRSWIGRQRVAVGQGPGAVSFSTSCAQCSILIISRRRYEGNVTSITTQRNFVECIKPGARSEKTWDW